VRPFFIPTLTATMPTQAQPLLHELPSQDSEGHWRAVIEAAQGTRNKLKYLPELGALSLHAVLPLGTSFPYDFGFVPSTLGEDGDPLDVLVFMDQPVPPGTVVPCRLIGVIEASQKEKGEKARRNDRVLAVAAKTHRYGLWQGLGDVPANVLEEIERFFVFYNQQKGVTFKPLGRRGPAHAKELLAQGQQLFKQGAKKEGGKKKG
jgi:inorganic pyrophosphatase